MKSPISDSPEGSSSSSNKICVVCGDKSYGLNFNAITCESCKAFFRRNALSTKELTCPFSNVCTVTRVTRRFCQKCRLTKCFAVGMKKEHIMSEEDKLRKRKKIESNRARKSASTSGGEPPVKVKKEELEAEEDPITLLENATVTGDGDVENRTETRDHQDTSKEAGDSSQSNESNNLIPSSPSTSSATAASTVAAAAYLESSFVWPTLKSSPTEIVSSIIDSPVGSGRIIGHLMKTPQEAILVMEKIINSPKDAIQMIGHFINSPGGWFKSLVIPIETS